MAGSEQMTLDMSEFLERTKELSDKIIPAATESALVQTGFDIKVDCEMRYPKTPHLEGWLRSNVRVEMISENVAIIEYLMRYGAWLHEAVDPEPNWSENDVGPKWLETRLLQQERWGEHMAKLLKQFVEAS